MSDILENYPERKSAFCQNMSDSSTGGCLYICSRPDITVFNRPVCNVYISFLVYYVCVYIILFGYVSGRWFPFGQIQVISGMDNPLEDKTYFEEYNWYLYIGFGSRYTDDCQ